MSNDITIFTKVRHANGRFLSISRQKVRKLIAGEADRLVHRAVDENGPIIKVYEGKELMLLLSQAVMNGRVVQNERGQSEVEYFLAPISDPNGVLQKIAREE